MVVTQRLVSGKSKSCGCYRREHLRAISRKHGMSTTAEWQTWNNMKRRCSDQSRPEYVNYGERGITVCERWRSFENFYADMGPRPSAEHTIERVNNDGPYSPENCCWLHKSRQNRNRRSTKFYTAHGKSMTLAEWARELGLHRLTLVERIQRGWPVEEALVSTNHQKGPKRKNRLGQ